MSPPSSRPPKKAETVVGGRLSSRWSTYAARISWQTLLDNTAPKPLSYRKLYGEIDSSEEEFVGWLGYGRISASPKYFAVTVSRLAISNVESDDGIRSCRIELSFTGDANSINSTLRFVRNCEKASRQYQLVLIPAPKRAFGKLNKITLLTCDLGPVTATGDVRTWKIAAKSIVRSLLE